MSQDTGNELGTRLRERRDMLGLSRAQLASLADVSQEWIKKVESGEQRSPRVELVARVARALEIPPEDLVEFSGIDVSAFKAQTAVERHERLNASFLNLQNLSPERFDEAVRYLETLTAMDKFEFQKGK